MDSHTVLGGLQFWRGIRLRAKGPLWHSESTTRFLDGGGAQSKLLGHLCQGLLKQGTQKVKRKRDRIAAGLALGGLALAARADHADLRFDVGVLVLFDCNGEVDRRLRFVDHGDVKCCGGPI